MTVPENAIPAGSLPPEQGKAAEQKGKENEGTDSLILGKFKSADDLINAYQNLEQDHGRLGSELGQARKQNEPLMDLVSKSSQGGNAAAATKPAQPEEDYQKLLNETTNAVEQGEMSVGEGLKKVSEITAKMVGKQTMEEMARLKSQTDAEAYAVQFKKDHPDFQQALESGSLEAIKKTNPMHDNVSAYFEWKANQAQTDVEQRIKEAYEKGKADLSNLAAGAQATTKVLGRAGSEARVTNAPAGPLNESDKISGMMGILRAARGAGT
jgi:hypothetical protein